MKKLEIYNEKNNKLIELGDWQTTSGKESIDWHKRINWHFRQIADKKQKL